MLLYHFTSRANYRSIAGSALRGGSLAGVVGQAVNAVWLTTDPGPDGHGLEAGGRFMTAAERERALEWSGTLPPDGTRFPKPAEVRLAVEIPDGDRNLHSWLTWSRGNVAPDLFARIHPAGSPSLRKGKTWRLYFGVILPDAFRGVHAVDAARDAAEALRVPAAAQDS